MWFPWHSRRLQHAALPESVAPKKIQQIFGLARGPSDRCTSVAERRASGCWLFWFGKEFMAPSFFWFPCFVFIFFGGALSYLMFFLGKLTCSTHLPFSRIPRAAT